VRVVEVVMITKKEGEREGGREGDMLYRRWVK
jgi:hypothetical protein